MSLVLGKRALALAAYHPTAKRARTAVNMAKFAYSNRKTFARAGRKILRAYRSYKRRRAGTRKKRNLFTPQGFTPTSNTKKVAIENDATIQSLGTRTLYQSALGAIAHTTTNQLNGRQRDIANITGFRICMEVANQATSAPLYFNCALVTPRKNDTVLTTEFFRANEGQTRAVDFDTARTSTEFHCLPINTDEYTIQFHRRYRLAPKNGTETGRSYMNFDRYIRYKRQMRYPGTGSTPNTQQPFFIFWFDLFSTPSGGVAIPNQAEVNRRFVTYFREPKA